MIRVPEVRVVGEDGANLGIMKTSEALRMAFDQDLDLIEINPKSNPPVVKIINYGKFKYEEKKKLSEMKKNQQISELKEITFRPSTEEHDLIHKLQAVKDFLAEGHKVRLTVRFKGRETMHPEFGTERINWFIQQLVGFIQPAPPPTVEGKTMSVVIAKLKQ